MGESDRTAPANTCCRKIFRREEHMTISHETLLRILHEKDLRPSFQRLKVLEYLHDHSGHPTVDDIYASLITQMPSLSKATVYNTLHALVDAGLARPIRMDGAENRYDLVIGNHGHFQCERCGEIFNFQIDLDCAPVSGLTGFQVKTKDVYFHGECPNCLKFNTPFKE